MKVKDECLSSNQKDEGKKKNLLLENDERKPELAIESLGHSLLNNCELLKMLEYIRGLVDEASSLEEL